MLPKPRRPPPRCARRGEHQGLAEPLEGPHGSATQCIRALRGHRRKAWQRAPEAVVSVFFDPVWGDRAQGRRCWQDIRASDVCVCVCPGA